MSSSSSDNSSYESAPQALDSDVGTLTNDGPAADGDDDAMAQEESSDLAPNLNADPVTDPTSNPNPNPNPNPDPPKRRGRKKKEVPVEAPPDYMFRFQEEERAAGGESQEQGDTEVFKYKLNDLVWGKVKSHPWWPGQIYDPALASEAALKIKKESHLLVAYFGDKTFAWVDASCLKPYMMSFPKMDKQSRVDAFVKAVDSSLAEVSRRIELALSCSCSDKGAVVEQLVDNAGIVDGTRVPDVDNSLILESFKIERVMEYVHEVAVYGPENTNRLEAAIGRAYLKGFDKFRGFPDAPEFGYGEEFGNDPDKISELEKFGSGRRRKKKDEQNKNESKKESETTPKKRGRAKRKKQVPVNADDSDYDPQSDSDELPKRGGSSKRGNRVKMSSDESDPSSESSDVPKKRGRPKKMKKQAKISDSEYDSTSESDEMPKKRGRPKKKTETSYEVAQPVSRSSSSKLKSPVTSDTSTPRKRGRPKRSETRSPSKAKAPTESDTGSLKKRGRRKKEIVLSPSVPVEYPPSTEMLTELCLTAQNPVRRSSFTTAMQSFFTKYSNSLIPESVEEKDLIDQTASATKSGRKISKPKHIQDSYWTDVMVDTGSDKDEDLASVSGQKKKRGPYNRREKSDSKKSEVDVNIPIEEDAQVRTGVIAENSDESEPTGLVLIFNNPDMIPTVQELNEIFGPHGLLREAETEIDKKLKRATVIFKRRVDAEGAFSSTGKYSKFGPALLSYELNYSPGPLKKLPGGADVVSEGDALTTGGKSLVDNGETSIHTGADLNVSPGEEAAQASTVVDIPVEPSA